MTNNNNGMTTDVQIVGSTLDEVQSFKYLGAIISEECSKPEVLARIAQATAALSSLKIVCRPQHHSRIKDPSDALCRDINIPVCMRNLGTHRRPSTQNKNDGDAML